jgi:hypothetical protein
MLGSGAVHHINFARRFTCEGPVAPLIPFVSIAMDKPGMSHVEAEAKSEDNSRCRQRLSRFAKNPCQHGDAEKAQQKNTLSASDKVRNRAISSERVPCEIVIAMLKRFKIIADCYRKPPIWPALLPHRRDLQHGARGRMMVMQEVYSPPTCRLCPADNDTFFGKGAPGAARETLHDEPHGLRASALSRHRADDLVSGLPSGMRIS